MPPPPRISTVSIRSADVSPARRSVNPLLLAALQAPALRDARVRQPALAVERRFAAGAGGGDGLPIDVIDDVAAGEDALDVGNRRMMVRQHDVAPFVELQLSRVRLRVRRVP